MMMMEEVGKGTVCVTGGTGFLASWLIMRLLQHGYSVNITIRPDSSSGCKRDVSYLTNLPGASDRLEIFNAELDNPESYDAAIRGCIGVFHVAHPSDFHDKESEETKTKRAVNGTLGILRSCLNSKTVRRVVYTSSAWTVIFNENSTDYMDENTWSNVAFIRKSKFFGASDMITKTLTEKSVLEFAEKHGLDLVSVIPSWITGPFITPSCPGSVHASMALVFGDEEQYKHLSNTSLVHIDDVASAHIFLFEHPDAKGRYICSAVDVTVDKLSQVLSARYPEYHIPVLDYAGTREPQISSKKLLDTGFKFKYGLEDIYDGAVECCKKKGIL
ncbi:hypothetical protein Leryth_001281 [Lithospermum erythrorhizon]|nr:hypothetical protein Leryth_001281 [Lithospermum erythrorhizon]